MKKTLALLTLLVAVLCLGVTITLVGDFGVGVRQDAMGLAQPLTGSGSTETPELLPVVTEAPITPTVPVTPTTPLGTAEYFASAEYFVDKIAFKPGSTDLVFTVTSDYEKGEPDLFLYPTDGEGDLDGPVTALAGFPNASITMVKSNDAAGKYAVALSHWTGRHTGEYMDDIALLDIDGSNALNFTNNDHKVENFWWLPDGTALQILNSAGHLIEKDLSTGDETTLATGLVGDSGAAGVTLTFSPNSDMVALGRVGNYTPTLEIYDRSEETLFTVAQWTEYNSRLIPVFSNDGDTIFVFLSHVTGDVSELDLYSVDPEENATPSLVASVSLANTDSGYVAAALAHPSEPYLYYSRDYGVYRIGTDGTGDVKIAGDTGTETVWADIDLQVVEGLERLAYVATQNLDGTPQSPGGQPIFTKFTLYSIDASIPPTSTPTSTATATNTPTPTLTPTYTPTPTATCPPISPACQH